LLAGEDLKTLNISYERSEYDMKGVQVL